jgi:hypothetical protein
MAATQKTGCLNADREYETDVQLEKNDVVAFKTAHQAGLSSDKRLQTHQRLIRGHK